MDTIGVKDINRFKIKDDTDDTIYYGGFQQWYHRPWQRLSGCGPTVISGIMHYENQRTTTVPVITKPAFVQWMEKTWRYVTPTIHGIPTTEMLAKKTKRFVKVLDLPLTVQALNIPAKKYPQPSFTAVIAELQETLAADQPIAFLTLDAAGTENIEDWHWTTLVEIIPNQDHIQFKLLDEGKIILADFSQWFSANKRGGGFVYLKQI